MNLRNVIFSNQFNKLLYFPKFELKPMYSDGSFHHLIHNCKDHRYMDYFFDHIEDLYVPNRLNQYPVHFLPILPENTSINLINNYLNFKNNSNILETRDTSGWKPIHYICEFGSFRVCSKLFDNVDVEPGTKFTNYKPIHLLCGRGGHRKDYFVLDLIKKLVSMNVDINATTYNGWSPIHFAYNFGSYDLCMYFQSLDIKVSKTDDGYYPTDLLKFNYKLDYNERRLLE